MVITKKKKLIAILSLLLMGTYFGWFSNIRYTFEYGFGNPLTFFHSLNIGVMYDDSNMYIDEIPLADADNIEVQMSNHIAEASKDGANVNMYLHGNFVNSNDRLIVLLNGDVIYNSDPKREYGAFYEKNYIKKRFVIKLDNFLLHGDNDLLFSTGNALKRYTISSN